MEPAKLITAALVGSPVPELLDDAARYAAARRANLRTCDLPPPQPLPEQEPNQPGKSFVATVGAILHRPATQRDSLLVHALEMVAQAGKVLPARLLVALLEVARTSRPVADALTPVLGARGRWLVGLNPGWLPGKVGDPKPEDWDEGSVGQRVAWLRHLRLSDPEAGRELVFEARKEKAADRAMFIAALEVGLSLGDEDLLEQTLRDRSKEVGRTAAGLLAKLDGSAYLERVVALAKEAFTRVELPATGRLATLRRAPSQVVGAAPPEDTCVAEHYTSLVPNLPKGPAGRLVALAWLVPPRRWAELGFTLEELSPNVMLDDEPVRIVDALSAAVARWQDAAAARTLLVSYPNAELALLLPPDERDIQLERVITATMHHTALKNHFVGLCKNLVLVRGLRLTSHAAHALVEGIAACMQHRLAVPDEVFEVLTRAVEPQSADPIIERLTSLARDQGSRLRRLLTETAASLTLHQSIYESMKEPR